MVTDNSRDIRGLSIETEEKYESQTPKHSYSYRDDDSKDKSKREVDMKV